MRLPPALIALAAVVVVVVGASAYLHRTAVDATATSRAPAEEQPAEGGVAPAKDVPQLVLPEPLPVRSVEVPILMYHRVAILHGDETGDELELTVDPQEFGLQMAWLKDNGFQTITQLQLFNALMQGAPLPERPVMITFDDGYRGVATFAGPIMARYGFVGTAYVISDRIARRPKAAPSWMTWGHLRGLEALGWDIGSHTATHRALSELSSTEAVEELEASQAKLERILGHPVQWFSYPDGDVTPTAAEPVGAAGFVLAVTSASGTSLSAQQPLELPRILVTNDTGVRGLAAAIS